MLCVAPKGRIEPAISLSDAEDRLLRRTFGRFGDLTQRGAAAEIVRRWQLDGPGHWVLCDCRGSWTEEKWPPALVPVAESHLRRHIHGSWPAHAADCDFFKEPAEQRVTTLSYRRPDRVEPIIKGFAGEEPSYRVRLTGVSQAGDRPPLARLLMCLMDESSLAKVSPGWQERDLAGQYRMLRRAARDIFLTEHIRLATYLETFAPHYEEFRERIEALPATKFKGSRPHGIMLCPARTISEGAIGVSDGPPLPVLGKISVFGETEGHGRLQDNASRRPPYLVAALVGRPSPEAPAAILRAYAHPVVSRAHLLLVDSDYERRTLKRLMMLQKWLVESRNILATIEKPLFDIGSSDEHSAEGSHVGGIDGVDRDVDTDPGARPPVIPDFIVSAKSANGATAKVIVETMGYDDERYRERKERVHPLMRTALNDAPMVLHRCFENGGDPKEIDRDMGRQVLRALFQQIDPPKRRWARSYATVTDAT